MSVFTTMKMRVKKLLKGKRAAVLLLLLLAVLPYIAMCFVPSVFRYSIRKELAQVNIAMLSEAEDFKTFLSFAMAFVQPDVLLSIVLSMLPILPVMMALRLLLAQPAEAAVSAGLIDGLKGRKIRLRDGITRFCRYYPRYAIGMAYRSLWTFLWMLAVIPAPIALYIIGTKILNYSIRNGAKLNLQVWVYGGIVALCLIWFLIFTVALINRLLAYSLTPAILAGEPDIRACDAVRLSEKMMTNCKLRLIAFCVSFLPWFVPTVLLGIAEFIFPEFGILRLLKLICFAITILWLAPYFSMCIHAFYLERKKELISEKKLTSDEFHTAGKEDMQ